MGVYADQDLDWWVSGTGDLINAEGKKLVDGSCDGRYILEGDANAPVAETAEEAPAEPAVELAENEKLGTAKGMGGDVTVKVTMDGDKIAAVEVVSQNETAGISDPALEKVPAAIVEANSADVDGVAGATVTSDAIKNAVKDALSK